LNNTLQQVFENFTQTHVLIVGDVMLDTYWWGDTNRISPEAPVPVVDIAKTEHRLGGAANVALNTVSLGAKTSVCSLVGNDDNAFILKKLLQENNITTSFIAESNSRKTTQKNRVMSRNHQLLRFDVEHKEDLNDAELIVFQKAVDAAFNEKPNIIILQDYNKGVLTQKSIIYILDKAQQLNIPVAVDPKLNNFSAYKNVALFKPNLKETKEALHISIDKSKPEEIHHATAVLQQHLNAENILITLSEYGAAGRSKNKSFIFPAHERNIADVSGAGDTVIAVAALCISQQLNFELTAQLANIAGGLVCEAAGVTPIDKFKLQQQATLLLQ
jgi:D-glycero-beta-D-manno-heptose-7-phosphate kinase